jgi:PAS domain-containing protein
MLLKIAATWVLDGRGRPEAMLPEWEEQCGLDALLMRWQAWIKEHFLTEEEIAARLEAARLEAERERRRIEIEVRTT